MLILDEHNLTDTAAEERLQPLDTALNRYCLALTRSVHEAEDLAQDTWAKALGYSGWAASPNPQALLLRIAKHTWIDSLRRKAAHQRAVERGLQPAVATAEQEQTGLSELETVFHALVNYLPPLQLSIFLMRDVFGYPAQETADQLDTTEGAVKAALYRARQALAAVRMELAADGPALAEDSDFRRLLRALAEAYEQGQLPVMLELLRRENAAGITMAAGIRTVRSRHSTVRTADRAGMYGSVLMMAA
ncbi:MULTISPECIES: RNA polymerase sigma factor [unclassified Paenibacillus]|uniref:RNA polymerase sigma factor n=1 Tax=unclassified Paenibacillus TaxID=185978 RepID=UPI0024056AF6|nr:MULTISPECIES: RNA polymerase sigma factor [unclassified Paenibacillus]MDF9842273.1 RNA polymerase sigma factor (sigma-70 family) [Paenibacillus sp. PastF-2]MDF9848850.1 RNA polymerase sigma factor (sigma-70 family) [Paenibacillus sp. PastM-2]MDF9855420.1 RNA polymerase sigma factor (sigma-70 family) [Paenibacillus sp. PastF-1]MDH6480704.1 RNA polymerase sigma factor (sigma-70 family) [Paenibacillus sp. PastH-2]MDH6508115.1 RNA polymerase sigma factor (sigma-70 family) [Paenibacillus sp. Pas